MLEISNGAAKWGAGKAHNIPAGLLEEMRQQPRDNPDNRALLKLFTPDGGATWKLSEIDYEDEEEIIFYGLCDLGMGFPELGYVSLSELASVRGVMGLRVERDLYYSPEPMQGIKI